MEGLAQVASIIKRLALEEQKRADITDHYRLLFARGAELEDAVFKAFKSLGFDEIDRVKENDGQSSLFKFQTLGRYEYGLLEVQGANIAAGPGTTISSNQWTFTYTGINAGDDIITATLEGSSFSIVGDSICVWALYSGSGEAPKTWSMFVIPESPIGIIALLGSSLTALGGFMFWKRKQGSSQPHSVGDLGI